MLKVKFNKNWTLKAAAFTTVKYVRADKSPPFGNFYAKV